MTQNVQILALLRASRIGSRVVDVGTEQFRDDTWVRFLGRNGYQTVSREWDLTSTTDSVASDLIEAVSSHC